MSLQKRQNIIDLYTFVHQRSPAKEWSMLFKPSTTKFQIKPIYSHSERERERMKITNYEAKDLISLGNFSLKAFLSLSAIFVRDHRVSSCMRSLEANKLFFSRGSDISQISRISYLKINASWSELKPSTPVTTNYWSQISRRTEAATYF